MGYQLSPFKPISLHDDLLDLLIQQHENITLPRLERLWKYYRNALAEPDSAGGSSNAPAQQVGLPPRLVHNHLSDQDDRFKREIVIENDIAWRIHTLVDFMFPKAPKIVSKARNTDKRYVIEAILQSIFDANEGVALWQDAALLGSIYGHVDFLINTSGLSQIASFKASATSKNAHSPGVVPSNPSTIDLAARVASNIHIETVEAPRAIALLSQTDYRKVVAYIIHYQQYTNEIQRGSLLTRLSRAITPRFGSQLQRSSISITEIYSATHFQRYEDGELVAESPNRLGVIPVVHVQNLSQPLYYEGLSDVEPLIPLQDELNTRLSDRANRVTMQSFRMWLGKGLEGFADRPIGPGQMWMTDNLDASIEAFGGDADSPSETAHLEDLREALDKTSGVTPAAAGHIKAKVGNLSSENALRISLMGTIAKVNRKRVTYGAGIEKLCDLILHALNVYGIFPTDQLDRQVEVVWADALPIDESRRLADALAKSQLGVPLDVLRAELGYTDEKPVKALSAS
ncbi:MAG: phage portal protein [Planctomycetes bacterium]|nr:phage portal protein [Planctomycetota bacterium]